QRDDHPDQADPEVVRDREQQPEEDRQSRAPQIVVDDQADRVPRLGLGLDRRGRSWGRGRRRFGGQRVAHGPRAYAFSSSGTTRRFQRSVPTIRKSEANPTTTFRSVVAMYIPTL